MNDISRVPGPAGEPTKYDIGLVAHYGKRYKAIGFRDFDPSADIAEADREPLRKALQACMIPPTERQMAEAIATISASWPHAYQKVDAVTLDLHLRLLADDLAEFPPDALFAGIRDLRRKSKFMPSIAELCEAVNEHVWTRGWLLKAVETQDCVPGPYCLSGPRRKRPPNGI